MNVRWLMLAAVLAGADAVRAADFAAAAATTERDLAAATKELAELREQIAAEKIPLSKELSAREAKLLDTRGEYESVARLLDSRNLDLSNLRTEIKARQEERNYVSNLLAEYGRNFETRIHISELQRYREPIERARLTPEKSDVALAEVLAAQAGVVEASLDRLIAALGGEVFNGQAVGADGLVRAGKFALFGPVAVFQSDDGQSAGLAEQRLGSLEPTIIPLEDSAAAAQIKAIATTGKGQLPFDPTLGYAQKIAQTRESLWEHIGKGGPVMIPILLMAAAAFAVAVIKWVQLAKIRKPDYKSVDVLLDAVERRDEQAARTHLTKLAGPAAAMVAAGLDHFREPPALVEEVMYERMMETRLKLQSWLPFIALSASAAPLLGLLGTVTGMINTFKMITVFGSGDAKTLSGGISEALITTEFGLIVAIPSLLLYAFLSRKAKGIIDGMEKVAVAFMNRFSKSHPPESVSEAVLAEE